MKKLLATILALVMAIGLTTAAWADGEGTTAIVAKIGENGYATLAEAITAAQAGETIVLQANAAINSNTQITKDVALRTLLKSRMGLRLPLRTAGLAESLTWASLALRW